MTPFRPTSYDRPGEQISTTPSGLKVTSAKRLMVDSMNDTKSRKSFSRR